MPGRSESSLRLSTAVPVASRDHQTPSHGRASIPSRVCRTPTAKPERVTRRAANASYDYPPSLYSGGLDSRGLTAQFHPIAISGATSMVERAASQSHGGDCQPSSSFPSSSSPWRVLDRRWLRRRRWWKSRRQMQTHPRKRSGAGGSELLRSTRLRHIGCPRSPTRPPLGPARARTAAG